MTPKNKAKELVEKMFSLSTTNAFPAKQCAVITVNEIIDAIDWDYYEGSKQSEHMYWKAVKQEIEKL